MDERYFVPIGSIPRFPRYKNKRGYDPYVKGFVDQHKIDFSGWQLPIPNHDASYKSLSKYAKGIPVLDDQQVEDMNTAWYSFVESEFFPFMGNSSVRTLPEAIDAVDKTTSSGSPFSLFYPTKNILFANDSQIMDWLEKDWELLASDPNWTGLFTNSLKEELRTDEKTAMNSIRTFLAGSVDLTIHGIRLFDDMNEKFCDSHLKTSSAVGMSPFDGHWDQMIRKLGRFKKGFALDESQYDSSLRAFLLWSCAEFRWRCLAPEFRTKENFCRLRTYYRNIVNSLIVTPDGTLVFKKGGNPSGSVNTISDNTLILFALLSYAWVRIMRDHDNSYNAFVSNVAMALVGDDNTWTVSESCIKFFNAKSVIAEWKGLGITTTTDSLEPRGYLELDFLSAHTISYKGVFVPLYDTDKLFSSLLYAPTKHHSPAVTLERCAALMMVGWMNKRFRVVCQELTEWLKINFGAVCHADDNWKHSLSQLKPDDFYETLFLGVRSIELAPQGFTEVTERSIKPYKKEMSFLNKNNVVAGRVVREEPKVLDPTPRVSEVQACQFLMTVKVDVTPLENKKRLAEIPLVGVELNPGPPKKAQKKAFKKAVKKEEKREERKMVRVEKRLVAQNGYHYTMGGDKKASAYNVHMVSTVAALDRHLAKFPKLSAKGREFLKMTLDPFHDNEFQPCGWPDKLGMPSVVREMKQSMDLAYPVGNASFPGGLWDCYVVLQPWLNAVAFRSTNRTNNVITTTVDPGPESIGGVQAWATNSHVDFAFGGSAGPNPPIPLIGTLEIAPEISQGAGRLVGFGIEAVNTTADIYKQGLVTNWRAPEPYGEASTFSWPSGVLGNDRSLSCAEMRYPPQNSASALLYKGAKQWDACDGSYMIGTFLADENPPVMVNYTQPYFTVAGTEEDQTTVEGVVGSLNTTEIWIPDTVSTAGLERAQPAMKIYPINQMGMIFTGLSQQTTVTIRFTYFYESFPSITQNQVVTLARDNTPYDRIALSYLTAVYRRMPVAVPVKENFDGEWWANVVEWLGTVAGIATTAFGLPEVGAAIGAASQGGAKLIRSY